jgi:hypothetical protein
MSAGPKSASCESEGKHDRGQALVAPASGLKQGLDCHAVQVFAKIAG